MIKKFWKLVVATILSLVCATTFTACGSDDDEQKTEVTRNATFLYSFTLNDELLSVTDITIRYIGTDGAEKQETMSSSSWSKTFSAEKFNVSSGVRISMKLKSGIELAQNTYKVSYSFIYSAKATENGTTIDYQQLGTQSSSQTISADKLEKFLQEKGTKEAALKVNAEGKVEETTLSW